MADFVENEDIEENNSEVEEAEEGNFDDWNEDEDVQVKSLFEEKYFGSVESLLANDLSVHGFDMKDILKEVGFNDLIVIMTINFIRSSVATLKSVDSAAIADIREQLLKKEYLSQEQYMKPILQDDALLYMLHDTLVEEFGEEDHNDEWDAEKHAEEIEASRQNQLKALSNYSELASELS